MLPMLCDPRFPNVLPEGTEDPIGVAAIQVPGGAPGCATFNPGPEARIGKHGWLGHCKVEVRVMTLFNSAMKMQPKPACDLDCSFLLWEVAAVL